MSVSVTVYRGKWPVYIMAIISFRFWG